MDKENKLTGAINYAELGGTYQWYNVTTSKYLGTGGNAGNSLWKYVCSIATAYITPVVKTSVALYCLSPSTLLENGLQLCTWAIIEVVANNNTITAFTGATSATDGIVGYIPAPLAGTQNSYLRGDGKWIQANNAPTAALYLFATSNPNQGNIGSPYNIEFPTVLVSSGITETSKTTFSIPAGGTYRLSGCVTLSTNVTYRFYANGSPIGEGAQNLGAVGGMSGPIALAYLTTTTTTTVSLTVEGSENISILGNDGSSGRGPWIEILQISNNNAITAFTWATSAAAGAIGYIPAPAAGQQNHVLTGAGSWAAPGPTFSAYKTFDQSSTGGMIVTFDKIEIGFDTEKCFNISSSSYKPNVAGYYQVNASVYYQTNLPAGSYQLYLNKNGAVYKRGTTAEIPTRTEGLGINMSTVVSMNGTTDYIQISTDKQNGNVNVYMKGDSTGTLTWFNAIMVRPL